MQKTILTLAICVLIPCVYVAVARADDESDVVDVRGVAQRVSCEEIKQEMDSLSDDDSERLSILKMDYRSKCMKRSRGRSIGQAKVQVTEIVEDIDTVSQTDGTDKSCDTPDVNGCCPGEEYTDLGDQGFNCCTKDKEHCFPPVQTDLPKCEDGTQPDDNGCCSDETYTDLGDQGFNCCLGDGITCYPPLGK